MTKEELDRMTESEIWAFDKKCSRFNKSKSIEEYTIDLRDLMYLFENRMYNHKNFTFGLANKIVKSESGYIKRSYDGGEPLSEFWWDIAYCCG